MGYQQSVANSKKASEFGNIENLLDTDYLFVWRPGFVEPMKIQKSKVLFDNNALIVASTPAEFPNTGSPNRLYLAESAVIDELARQNVLYTWTGTAYKWLLADELERLNAAIDSKLPKGTYPGDAGDLIVEAKGYTDSMIDGAKWKDNVDVATTANITLSGEQVIDGIQTAASRVLVKDQTNPIENGIYLTSSTAWTRTADADANGELVSATVTVAQGTVNAEKIFYCTSDTAIIGTDSLDWITRGNAVRHNSTTGLQGGDSAGDEYFHLSAEEKTQVAGLPANVESVEGSQAKADKAELDAKAYSDQLFTGKSPTTGVISIKPSWIQGTLSYNVYAKWNFSGTLFEKTEKEIHDPVDPANPTFKRIDKYALDNLGNIVILKGVESENPISPTHDPATQLDTEIITIISAGATTPDGVSGTVIFDEGDPGEFVVSGGPSFDTASPNTPNSGSICIETVEPLGDRQSLVFTGGPIPIEQVKEVQLYIKNKTGGLWEFLVRGNKSNGRADSFYIPVPDSYDPDNTTDYQLISFFVSSNTVVEVTGFSIVSGFDGFEYFVDDIIYVSGTEQIAGDFATVQYVNQKSDETLQAAKDYADSLVISGGDNVHDSYDTMALMIADQANQIDGEFFVVVDASAHSTVEAGWAFFEYLGTTLGTEEDYRKLSEQESLDIVFSAEVTQAEHDALAARVTTLEGEGIPKEHEIAGIREDDAAVTGAKSLDWNAYSSYNWNLTGAATLSDANLPTGQNTKVATIRLTGDFGFTVPAYWDEIPGDTYDGTISNKIIVEVINGTPGSEKVEYQIINNPV